jgi:hypothetical protein
MGFHARIEFPEALNPRPSSSGTSESREGGSSLHLIVTDKTVRYLSCLQFEKKNPDTNTNSQSQI